jgi:hypothetical protein
MFNAAVSALDWDKAGRLVKIIAVAMNGKRHFFMIQSV